MRTATSVEWTSCRACGGSLELSMDLGMQQVVDFPVSPDGSSRGTAPLVLMRCSRCTLVQLKDSVTSSELFTDAFWYRSGISESMRHSLQSVVDCAMDYGHLSAEDAVLDIGANDGTMLSLYPSTLFRVGCDPARSSVGSVEGKCEAYISDFFSARAAQQFREKYQVVTAIAMFYDLDDPHKFLADVASILAPDGVFIVQMNSLDGMFRQSAYDNICHEHVMYYSLTTFLSLLPAHDLVAVDASTNDVNGGSLRVVVGHRATSRHLIRPSVQELLREEEENATNSSLSLTTLRLRMELARGLITTALLAAPEPRYLYGASTRGATLFQSLHLDPKLFVGAAERDERKYGRYYINTGLPIVAEKEAREHAQTFLVLPWHFWDAIFAREKEWLSTPGRCLMRPLPFVFSFRT